MLIGPKYKICKRLGASVFEKCQTQKFQLAEARSPRTTKQKRGGGVEYGIQLLEKQKARFTYGISESQFARYVEEAMSKHGKDSAIELVSRLEARLDNVVYRAGFVKTRRSARQLVSHGHIMLAGRRMNIPSHKIVEGDVVSIRPESRNSLLFLDRAEVMKDTKTPSWMQLGEDGMTAIVTAIPAISTAELTFNAPIIIQFYSR